jgi:hypothetical protein
MKTENVTLCGTYTTRIGEIGAVLLHIYISYASPYETPDKHSTFQKNKEPQWTK